VFLGRIFSFFRENFLLFFRENIICFFTVKLPLLFSAAVIITSLMSYGNCLWGRSRYFLTNHVMLWY